MLKQILLSFVMAFLTAGLGPVKAESPKATPHTVSSAIYFGINTDTSLPFVELNHSTSKAEVKSGILKDLSEALAKEIKADPVFILLPKERVSHSVISGYIEIICYIHEVWEPELLRNAYWSQPIYTNVNLVVSLGKRPVKKMKDLYGQHVGVIVNFIYDRLQPSFEKGLIIRENGTNSESNVQKLLHGRIDYLILSNLEFKYYKKKYPKLVSEPFRLDSAQVKCVISKKSKRSLVQINKAIDTLKKNGALERIFDP